jgi:hypothetical protein
MTAMPILNRQPEIPYVRGLLMLLMLILLIAMVRYPRFFLHGVLGLR